MESSNFDVIILGAGPAGLTAAIESQKLGKKVLLIEKEEFVGGISRTVVVDDYRFDLGGHRFFTKVQRVEDFWHEILSKDDFLLRPRMSRIYYKGRFYDYPLKALNALGNLGIVEATLCVGSYIYSRIFPPIDQSTFEGWVSARFGKRLYRIFFKTYTEKVWGVPANTISSEWAAQRIKNLSLSKAILNSFGIGKRTNKITTLIDEFQYPRFGPGMMWEKCFENFVKNGGQVRLNCSAIEILQHSDDYAVKTSNALFKTQALISSIPITELPRLLSCKDPQVTTASENLKYRDFLTVSLVLATENAFPDNWIYIHSPEVSVGRIQNFRSWSPFMSPVGETCLGLEYFVNEGDSIWEMCDEELVDLASLEIEKLGIIDPTKIVKGYVVRVPKAYPVYDQNHEDNLKLLQLWLTEEHPNLHAVGRNGMHRYNNQDHSMLTAMLAVENIFLSSNHNLWQVNVDDEYHEIKKGSGGRSAPTFRS